MMAAELVPLAAKIKLSSADVDRDHLIADCEDGLTYHVAELWWDGSVWLFIPLDERGVRLPAETIDVDPPGRLHLNEVANENAKDRHERGPGVNEALDQALLVARTNHRDETREMAELMARGKARVHWRSYQLWVQGCTGLLDRTGLIQHDTDTCPHHEL